LKMPKRSSSSVRVFYPEFTREELIEKLKERIPALAEKLPLKLVVLFGSWSKGNYTVASDIDLLIVYSGEEREGAFALAKITIGIRGVEPHLYSEPDYLKMKTAILKMIKDGIVIFGEIN